MSERLTSEQLTDVEMAASAGDYGNKKECDEIQALTTEVRERRAADLTKEEHACLRRVLQIMIHLDGKNRRTGEWGDDLGSEVAVLDKLVKAGPK